MILFNIYVPPSAARLFPNVPNTWAAVTIPSLVALPPNSVICAISGLLSMAWVFSSSWVVPLGVPRHVYRMPHVVNVARWLLDPRTRVWALLWDTLVFGEWRDPSGSSFCDLLGKPVPLSELPPQGSNYYVLTDSGEWQPLPGLCELPAWPPRTLPSGCFSDLRQTGRTSAREDSRSGKRFREEGAPSCSRRADGGQGSTRATSPAQHGTRHAAATQQMPTEGGGGSGGPAGDQY